MRSVLFDLILSTSLILKVQLWTNKTHPKGRQKEYGFERVALICFTLKQIKLNVLYA